MKAVYYLRALSSFHVLGGWEKSAIRQFFIFRYSNFQILKIANWVSMLGLGYRAISL
jgi:hypothetical protein